MIKQARQNADKLGYNNVEFRFGDIEDMPVSDNSADVVVSNCVLNLVPNKMKVFADIHRVLKPGGHFSISDIVLEGNLPPALKNDAEMYAGCVAGAIQKTDYLGMIEMAGFSNVTVQKQKPIVIPEDVLGQYLNEQEISEFNTGGVGIYSVTVFATKPGKGAAKPELVEEKASACCSPNSGCC